jgi:hypothetical protein
MFTEGGTQNPPVTTPKGLVTLQNRSDVYKTHPTTPQNKMRWLYPSKPNLTEYTPTTNDILVYDNYKKLKIRYHAVTSRTVTVQKPCCHRRHQQKSRILNRPAARRASPPHKSPHPPNRVTSLYTSAYLPVSPPPVRLLRQKQTIRPRHLPHGPTQALQT